MGNVLAAGSPSPAAGSPAAGPGLVSVPPGFTMPQVSPLSPPAEPSASEGRLPNPGPFEECHRKCKGLWTQCGVVVRALDSVWSSGQGSGLSVE
ncbi:UNVERIFIED_CONTAM: hypothetical protein FKN15_004402 [Acipenser sinensis]